MMIGVECPSIDPIFALFGAVRHLPRARRGFYAACANAFSRAILSKL
jgi:hypothetical protein